MIFHFWKWIKLSFDKSFSVGKPKQLLWLMLFLAFSFGCFYLINEIFDLEIKNPVHILKLLMDPATAFIIDDNKVPHIHVFSFFIAVFGAIFFTGTLISILSNILEIRVKSYKNGLLRYKFFNHILILGSNNMIIGIIRALASNPETRGKDIVVLSKTNSEDLMTHLRSELTSRELKNVILLFGNRDSDDELIKARIKYVNRVYIIGENNETEHDSINISCSERIKRLATKREHVLRCFVVIDNLTSYHVFQYQKANLVPNVEVTLIDIQDSWAQQVLVSRKSDKIEYPAIDREGIGPDSNKRVHFVVVGMTQMAISMGNCVAHISHYPNFITKNRKTKISFIAPNIKQEMNFFKGHYQNLFNMTVSTYRSWNYNGEENDPVIENPNSKYGDFLDVEWEFLDGGIETPYIRKVISDWCANEKYSDDILTIAVCGNNSVCNLATSFYLPEVVHRNKIPIFVYQPNSSEILKQANSTDRYSHIYPFGMRQYCYDNLLRNRILQAKRYNYIYVKGDDYVVMTSDNKILNRHWYDLSFANQLSNIYAASSVYFKLRSMNSQGITLSDISDENIDLYAEVEHNRWNVEKLLVGFNALPIESRKNISNEEAKHLKKDSFIHKDITPYKELKAESKFYDRLIIRYMKDVIK